VGAHAHLVRERFTDTRATLTVVRSDHRWFELSERNDAVVFRHTHAISARPLDPDLIAWTWAMIRSAVGEFGPLVERSAGGLGFDDAAASVDATFAAIADD
jgi:hypothetical protein